MKKIHLQRMSGVSKTRILFCGEASWLATGYATYNREIIRRLHATGKYEIAEMGAYGNSEEPKAKELPWKFYGVLPTNAEEKRIYESSKINQFGAYKFDAVVADFQPDIIFDPRDPWMFGHIQNSRFRSNYKTVFMPTVDSAPQKKEWIEKIFKKTDVITTYSRYGKRVLEEEGVKVAAVTSPGVDLEVFSPKDRKEARNEWDLPLTNKVLVIGTVMRNQKRKLFPDLFEAYMEMRRRYPEDPAVKHSALLCHTSWPDVGWDLPELIRRNQIQRHVIFTYTCDSCHGAFLSWIITTNPNGVGRCVLCGEMAAHMPNTHNMVDDKTLARVFQSMDIYVQPSICEGWGLPIVEAKACGIPTIIQNYSAMEDHVENPGGLELKVGRFYTEAETMAIRSLPDHDDLIDKMYTLLRSAKKRKKIGKAGRKCAEEMHNWDLTAGKLEKIFDEIELENRLDTWDRRPSMKIISQLRIPENLPNEQFVMACYRNILDREPDEQGFKHWLKQLAGGASRQDVVNFFRNENITHNKFEQIRWGKSLARRGFNPRQNIMLDTYSLPGTIV
jgi:glycosyltransferase involved in cell wall biosynthesis